MKIRLLRKLGQNPAGAVVDRTHQEAEQLIRQGYAAHAPESDAAAPDEDTEGDDPNADPQSGTGSGSTSPAEPKHADLKAHAGRLQIATSGTKAELSERIEQHIAEHGDQPAPAND